MKVSAYWIIYKQNTNIKRSCDTLINKTTKVSNTPVSFLGGVLSVHICIYIYSVSFFLHNCPLLIPLHNTAVLIKICRF